MLDALNSALAQDALRGLTAPEKTLNPKWLYDQRGSHLFEEITELPEYYLTRTEAAILRDHAAALAGLVPAGGALVEFGAGASVKTRTLLDAGSHFGAYVPIDISASFLAASAASLRGQYPDMPILPVAGDFTQAVPLPVEIADAPKVGFFPGSTLGNLAPDMARQLMANARAWPVVDAFILGVDLVKDEAELVAAYDDSQGITAAFITNILTRLNSEAAADFDLSAFAYEAVWNADLDRIDMYIRSRADQTVAVANTAVPFAKGERIHISASRKYTPATLSARMAEAGWSVETVLTDAQARFAVAVLRPQ
ncbi:MAG: L-histidine N(alpha)-methyltransferase [Pseudomonadota bacterium]